MRKQSYLIILFSACLLTLIAYVFFYPVVTNETVYELKVGTSKKQLIEDLSAKHIIPQPLLFALMIYPVNNNALKAGEYTFPVGSTIYSIWQQVVSGSGVIKRGFTIIPGWTFKQLRQALLDTKELTHESATLDDQTIMLKLGAGDLPPEGEFFPDTYYFTKHISDMVILKRAYHRMQTKLEKAWAARSTLSPYKSPYEALIAASLIEKEAHFDYERGVISGVLVNRLRKGMLLQFDPTVIYGLGERYKGKIHREDLTENHAYNTYLHKGLPPTPIAIPSMASLMAAVTPDATRFYYFVARGDGSHQFSENLIQHHAATLGELSMTPVFFNDAKVNHILKEVWMKQSDAS